MSWKISQAADWMRECRTTDAAFLQQATDQSAQKNTDGLTDVRNASQRWSVAGVTTAERRNSTCDATA